MLVAAASSRGGDCYFDTTQSAAFRAYIAPQLEWHRTRTQGEAVAPARYKSEITDNMLPGTEIHVLPTGLSGADKVFAVDSRGSVQALGTCEWMTPSFGGPLANPRLTDYMLSQPLALRDSADAIAIARLAEELTQAPSTVQMLKANTCDFAHVDRLLLSQLCAGPENNWKWSARRDGDSWLAWREYVGPPASIMAPWLWRMGGEGDRLTTITASVGAPPRLPPEP
jgi:hypothetical protein